MLFGSVLSCRRRKTVVLAACLVWALAWMPPVPAVGESVASSSAAALVTRWLAADHHPLGASLGARVANVQAFRGPNGKPDYFVVNLLPSGFVVVSGDDLVEPIVAFSSGGSFDPSTNNPLGALVSGDLPARVEAARRAEARLGSGETTSGLSAFQMAARSKWRRFLDRTTASERSLLGVSGLSDPRVDPFIASKWNQKTECGTACYNYYTPLGPDGSASNYPAGCVATAIAQLMRYFQHPWFGVGTRSYKILVDGVEEYRDLRGGDGAGGPYDWASMVLDPDCSTTTTQRQAIAALCHDAGCASHTEYFPSASSATLVNAYQALIETFYYANVRFYGALSTITLDKLYNMVNPNLHAGLPVVLSITRTGGGHAVVCDGYGYNASTIYHHINLGWSGLDDAWYNLPTIDTSVYTYTSVTGCIYNVYAEGGGEIISGRVTDEYGSPVDGALVSTGTYSDTTDARGLYALAQVPSNTAYDLTVQKEGYVFAGQTVTTSYSQSGNVNAGNLWGVDFTGRVPVSVGAAKKNADDVTVAFRDVGVTAVFGDWFYVENLNRSSGILVNKAGHGLSVGHQVEVIGVTDTNEDSERFVQASYVKDTGQAAVKPVGMTILTLGGADWLGTGGLVGQRGVTGGPGLNNIGLLVRVYGRPTYIDSHNFTLDDDSEAVVHCTTPSDVTVSPLWEYVLVTGISSCEADGEELHRKLLIRSADDIQVLLP